MSNGFANGGLGPGEQALVSPNTASRSRAEPARGIDTVVHLQEVLE